VKKGGVLESWVPTVLGNIGVQFSMNRLADSAILSQRGCDRSMNDLKEMARVGLKELNGGKVLEVQLGGKLASEDYEQLVPTVERLVNEHGTIRILVEMHDFHGWTPSALWQDIKFDAKHFNDIERVAMVGETGWQHGMAVFCKPFTGANIRYFDRESIDEARAWIAGP